MKHRGVSLAQYAIVIAIVSVGVIGVYSMLGQEIVKQLNLFLKDFQDNNVKISNNAKIITQNPGGALTKPGQWNGGPGKPPVSKCTNGVCDIDFGDYILSGIPENFNDFTHSNGASGANDKIYSLYMQLANQLETNGDLAGAADLKILADLANYIGNQQKGWENFVKSCNQNANPENYFNSNISNQPAIKVPDELKNILSDIDGNDLYNQIATTPLGFGRASDPKNYNYSEIPFASIAFTKKYDEIINNPKYNNSSLKGILKEIYLLEDDTNSALLGVNSAFMNAPGQGLVEIDQIDPWTGNNFTAYYQANSLNDMINLTMDGNTNIVNALKCASQNYQNAQTVCHNQ